MYNNLHLIPRKWVALGSIVYSVGSCGEVSHPLWRILWFRTENLILEGTWRCHCYEYVVADSERFIKYFEYISSICYWFVSRYIFVVAWERCAESRNDFWTFLTSFGKSIVDIFSENGNSTIPWYYKLKWGEVWSLFTENIHHWI